MSAKKCRRTGSAALAMLALVGLSACATTTGGTAAVAPDATVRSTAVTTTERTTDTTRPTEPTASSPSSTSSASPTSASPTSAEITVRPTDAAGAAAPWSSGLLFIGDCYSVAGGNEVTVIDCAELHDGQVFATDVALTGVDAAQPSVEPWQQAATSACATDFSTFVGALTDRYAQSFVITSPPGGPPVVACSVVDVDAVQWAGSAESVSGSYFGIEIGDCFDYPTAVADALEVACDQPHEAEMYVIDAPLGLDQPDAPYPTEQQWQDLSETVCLGPFADYTGQSYESALDLAYTFVYPLEPDWSDVSQRVLSCAITSIDGTKLVGSKRA